jgi:hypothetical protein
MKESQNTSRVNIFVENSKSIEKSLKELRDFLRLNRMKLIYNVTTNEYKIEQMFDTTSMIEDYFPLLKEIVEIKTQIDGDEFIH